MSEDPNPEEFLGFLEKYYEGIAYIKLTSLYNGDILYGEGRAEEFLEKGIYENRSFKLFAYEDKVEFESIPERVLTDEELQEIEDRLAFLDDEPDDE